MTRYLNHLALDDFLPGDLRDGLLDYAIGNQASFAPSSVYDGAQAKIDTKIRSSWICSLGLGPFNKPFADAIQARAAELIEGLRMSPFKIASLELELAAHRNGSFFYPHLDTGRGHSNSHQGSTRMISTVFYLHSHPKGFSGGELALVPLGSGSPLLVEPRDNRLVAFPSFAPHAVYPVVCPVDEFKNARFAVNCWLHRPGDDPAAKSGG